MALTYADLIEVDLGRLGSAVADWDSTVKGLKTAAEQARTGMLAKSDAARWAGVNATVTRGFVTETAKEIADLHTEAGSIHHVLDDAHTELVSLQKQIRTAQAEARKWGISVQDYGDGTVHCVYPHVRGDTDVRTTEENTARDELNGRINRILAHAAEIDASVTRALNKSHGNDAHNAGHSSYESLDDAQAERAVELAKLGPEMTDKQYLELNSIMKFNARDADFSTDFYKSLGGPKDALEFYGRMSLNGTMGDNKDRLALAQQLQKNMGLALASATDPDNKSHLAGELVLRVPQAGRAADPPLSRRGWQQRAVRLPAPGRDAALRQLRRAVHQPHRGAHRPAAPQGPSTVHGQQTRTLWIRPRLGLQPVGQERQPATTR